MIASISKEERILLKYVLKNEVNKKPFVQIKKNVLSSETSQNSKMLQNIKHPRQAIIGLMDRQLIIKQPWQADGRGREIIALQLTAQGRAYFEEQNFGQKLKNFFDKLFWILVGAIIGALATEFLPSVLHT